MSQMSDNNEASISNQDEAISVETQGEKETQIDADPWPHLQQYFKFVRAKNNKNVVYQCLACLPAFKELSVNLRSYNNLKVHYKRAHGSSYNTFLVHLEIAKVSTMKSRKRRSTQADDDDPPQKQLCVDKSLSPGQFKNVDPWPHLKQYFKYIGVKDENNVIYQCLTCLPSFKELSVNLRSYNNLKVHYKRAHGSSYDSFLEYLENAKMLKQMSRKRYPNQPEGSDPPQKRVCTNQSIALGRLNPANRWPHLKKYFKFVREKNDKNVVYQCLACLPVHKELSASRQSYNNLKVHYRSAHGGSHSTFLGHVEKAKMSMQPRRRGSVLARSASPLQKPLRVNLSYLGRFCQNKYKDKLLDFFISNMIPLEVAESDSFRDLIKYCAPSAKDVSKTALARCIREKFLEKKNQLKLVLRGTTAVATTADVWSCRNRSYLGMTAHWVENDTLQRRKAVLACQRLKGPITYDVLSSAIQNILWEFEIDGKVCMMTTDNGSNFVQTISPFSPDEESGQATVMVSSNEPNEDGNDDDDEVVVNPLTDILQQVVDDNGGMNLEMPKHGRCTVHTLNLIAAVDARKALSCNLFETTLRSAFVKAQELWNKQSGIPEVADCIKDELGGLLIIPTTNWISIYDAFSQLKSFFEDRKKHAALDRVCKTLDIPAFSQADIRFCTEYIRVMTPLYQSLNILQNEKMSYYGILLPTLTTCAKTLSDMQEDSDLTVCKPLLPAIIDGLKLRFKSCVKSMDCLLAAAFHPHFKFSWVPLLQLLGCEDVVGVCVKLQQEMLHAITAMNNMIEADAVSATNQNSYENFSAEALEEASRKDSNSEKMLDDFLETGHEPQSKPIHMLLDNITLKELFVKYNTTIPSSAAVECPFSLGKDVLKPKPTGLSDEQLEMLVFLR